MSAPEELVTAGILISAEPIRFAHRLVQRAIYSCLHPAERTLPSRRVSGTARRQEGATEKSSPTICSNRGRHTNNGHPAILHRAGRGGLGRGATATAVRTCARAVDVAYPRRARPPEYH